MDNRDFAGLPFAAPALRAMLDDPAILGGCLDAFSPLVGIVANRLFNVDVLARLAGPDGDQRVPMVTGGDRDHVEGLIFKDFADVLRRGRRVLALPFHHFDPRTPNALVRVDKRGDADILHVEKLADVRLTAAVDPRHPDIHRIVRSNDFAGGFRSRNRKERKHRAGSGGLQNAATGNAGHGGTPKKRREIPVARLHHSRRPKSSADEPYPSRYDFPAKADSSSSRARFQPPWTSLPNDGGSRRLPFVVG